MERCRPLALYALAHFWVDLSCALLLFRTVTGTEQAALALLLYNFCAFALQMPLGLVADKLDRNGPLAAGGCLLAAVSFALPGPLPAAITAGLGNALFHLGGGLDTLNGSEKRAAALGIFVSPGALGLFVGTLWGKGGRLDLWLGPVGLVLLAAGILLLCRPWRSGNAPLSLESAGYGALLPLFLVVVLRSYMGMSQVFPWKGEGPWALLLTLALVLGKTAGGLLMDRLGPRRAAAWSLLSAAALYLFSGVPLLGTAAVFLFNMTMPITLWAVARVLPGARGFTFGMLTFALFVGYLPTWLRLPSLLEEPWACALAAVLSLLLLWRPLGRAVKGC